MKIRRKIAEIRLKKMRLARCLRKISHAKLESHTANKAVLEELENISRQFSHALEDARIALSIQDPAPPRLLHDPQIEVRWGIPTH